MIEIPSHTIAQLLYLVHTDPEELREALGELRAPDIAEALRELPPEAAAKVMAHKEHHPPIGEDSAPGSLNNVIAGRVAHHFDFTGVSFNVDADLASFPAALRMAELLLSDRDGLVVLLAVEEHYDPARFRIERPSVTCWLLASLAYAKRYDLPIEARLAVLVHSVGEAVACH